MKYLKLFENINFDDISEEEFEFIKDIHGKDIHEKDAVKLVTGGYLLKKNAYYSKYYNGYIDIDSGEYVLINNEWIYIDDTIYSNYMGDYYRADDNNLVWVDDFEDYVPIDDAKYSKRDDRYYHPDNNYIVYDECGLDWINIDTAVWLDVEGCYTHIDYAVYSKYYGTYISNDNAVYCEHDDDYILKDDSALLYDGKYTHYDNAVEIGGNKYAHKNDEILINKKFKKI